jgi:CPA2 family monovalent cation:H+ antiporter-2/glutathione-regulated potassium-efflux system protein KefB
VGISLDLTVIADQPLLIVGLALALVTVRPADLRRRAAVRRRLARSAQARLLLSQGGEFAFVCFGRAPAGRDPSGA